MNSKLLTKLLLWVLMCVPLISNAITQTVQVKQSTSIVPLGAPVMASIDWTVRGILANNEGGLPLVAPVISNEGRFCTTPSCSTVLGTVNKSLVSNSVVSIVPNISETLPIRELVRIPATVVRRAQQLGFSTVNYVRAFTDGTPLVSVGVASFNITSGAAGSFEITRIALSFSDGSPLKVLPKNQPLSVQADIGVTGVGLIQGVWEVANPVGLSDKPIFRPLERVQKQTSVTDNVKLEGPKLPTSITGLHVIRLRINSPNLAFEAPIIRYFVTGQDVAGKIEIKPILTNSPSKNASLTDTTKFEWDGIKDAVAYRLEIYEAFRSAFADNLPDIGGGDTPSKARLRPGQKPITGILLPAKTTETTLTKLSHQDIRAGSHYYWRIIAIDKNGRTIGESELNSVYAP